MTEAMSEAMRGLGGAPAPLTLRQQVGRVLLAAFLIGAGVAHLVSPEPFTAQVPPWFPAPGATIAVSGLVEIGLGTALLLLPRRLPVVGWAAAAFFLVVFPGNISQFLTGADAFGLDTDAARGLRLLLQPVLIGWALWCTGAWSTWRSAAKRSAARRSAGQRSAPHG